MKTAWKLFIITLLLPFSLNLYGDEADSCVLFKTTQTKHVSSVTALTYTASVGVMPIYDKMHHCIASMSYFAYTSDSTDKNRPITFVYAGGPGASSLTENFLVSGPKIISFNAKGDATQQSILQDNPETWLKFTDLVYIDMVGTGWGRIADQKQANKIFTADGDAETFSDFILSYLNQTHAFNRKIYLLGESYGGFRTPLVLTNLLKHFVTVNGIIMISPLLDNASIDPSITRLTDYALFMPTFIRSAIYHHRLSNKFLNSPDKTIHDGIEWSFTTYLHDLLRGDDLPNLEKEKMMNQLSEYTGLSKNLVQEHQGLISKSLFRHHLLDDKVIDYLDSRITDNPLTNDYSFHAFRIGTFMSSQLAMYPQAMQHALTELGVKSTETYINYFDPREVWKASSRTEVITVLHNNLMISPRMKVFFGVGYYDMDIPYYVTKASIAQLELPDAIRKNISIHAYPAGHMFYTDPFARKAYFDDIKAFYQTNPN